jgi:hypothetical protein
MSAATPNTKTGGVTKQQLIDIGRPNGPDLQLKFNPGDALKFQPAAPSTTTAGIISEESSITEVLNVLSFLISADRKFDNIVDADNSAATALAAGQIEQATGYYTDNSTGAFQEFSAAPFSLSTLAVTGPAADVHFPVSILKRRGVVDNDTTNPNSFEAGMDAKLIKNDASADESVKGLFVDSVKQMIKILTKTRMVLGPKGWTDLFQKVKGGSKNSKKTHRRHRRRYSSKQY